MRSIRVALLKLAQQDPTLRDVVFPLTRQAEKWEGMPKGWDADSRKKFWETLTGDNKHKVTKCIKEMSKGDKGIDDPGAFCAALADRVLGKGWRSKKAARWAREQDETEAHLSPKGDKLFDDFANGEKVNMTQLRTELEKAAHAAGHGLIAAQLAQLMIDGVVPKKKQAKTWTLDEGMKMFEQWYKSTGHWVYSTREKALKVWQTRGIENLPDYNKLKKASSLRPKVAKANVEPVRQRTQYSCMASSMTMCLRALDKEVTEDEVNRVMGARPMQGAAWEQALATAQHYGCRATLTMPSTVEQLKAWTDAGVPVMIAWNPEGRPWSHASVVFDVDDALNVYVADPNIPNPKKTVRVVPEDEFYGKWYEKFPDYLVRRPACAIEQEITPQGRQVMASRVAEKFPQLGFPDRVYHVDRKGNVWTPDSRTGKPIVGRPWSGTIPAGAYFGLQTQGITVNWEADVSATYNVREWKEYYALWAEYLELYGFGWEKRVPLVEAALAKFKNGFPPKNLRRELSYAQPPRFDKTDPKSAVAKLRAERERQSLVIPEDLALFQKMWRGKSEHRADTLWRSHKDAVKQWHWLGWVEQTAREQTNRDDPYREFTQSYGMADYYVLTKEGQKALQMSAEDLVGYKPRLMPKKPEAPKTPEPAPSAPAPSAPVDPKLKAKRLEVLGLVLNQYPDDSFLQGMRKLIENDRSLSDKQLSAIRRKLYMSRMKPEAEHFRTAAHVEAVRKPDKTRLGPPRNEAMRGLIERGNAGAGKHHTRDRDVEKGRSRKPKHKKDWTREAAGVPSDAEKIPGTKFWVSTQTSKDPFHWKARPIFKVYNEYGGVVAGAPKREDAIALAKGIWQPKTIRSARTARTAAPLDRGQRMQINQALVRAKLDGNGRFRKPEEAYNLALNVLAKFNIELDEVVSSHLFKQRPQGVLKVDIAYTNKEDSFSPISISNSILYIQYTELREDVFEAVAYLS